MQEMSEAERSILVAPCIIKDWGRTTICTQTPWQTITTFTYIKWENNLFRNIQSHLKEGRRVYIIGNIINRERR